MSTLRFCFLTTFYPPFNFGGDGIGVQRLARGLAKRGHAVTVVHDADAYSVLTNAPVSEAATPDPYGVDVVTLRSRSPMLSALLTQQTGHPVVNGRRLRKILRDGHFDVVNFNNVSLLGGPALLGYGNGAVTVYTAWEHWLVCPTHVLWRHGRERCDGRECLSCQLRYKRPPQLWRYTGLLERHLEDVDVFLALSEFSRSKHREFGFPRDMAILPPFLPDPDDTATPRAIPRPHARPYFLFVGRLERIKGLDEVLQVFARYEDADLVIVGDGDHRPVLQQIADGNLRVRFVGRLSPTDLTGYYQHALALIVPSVCFETFGITLIEAFSHATPVIARRLGPLVEIVEQSEGGELFETPDQLVDAMRAFQRAPERRAQAGRAGYQAYCERWCERAVIPKYLQIVEDARRRRMERSACVPS